MNFHELQEQLLMFTVASIILFGELSVGVQCLKALVNMMNRHVYFQGERMPRQRIPSQIPPHGRHEIPDLVD